MDSRNKDSQWFHQSTQSKSWFHQRWYLAMLVDNELEKSCLDIYNEDLMMFEENKWL